MAQSKRFFDFDAVKADAAGSWQRILTAAGISADYLVNRHGPCPLSSCDGQKSFRFDDKSRGLWICTHCGAGDGFRLVQLHQGLVSPVDAFRVVADILGGDYSAIQKQKYQPAKALPQPVPDMQLYKAIEDVWDSGVPITVNDRAGVYLTKTRGIKLDSFPSALRYSRRHHAMIAAYVSPANELVQVQRYLLTGDGQKVDHIYSKPFMPSWLKDGRPMVGGAIKLYKPNETLAVGEGLETCLAYYAVTGTPVWATANAGQLRQVEIPQSVRRVIVLADNDASGTGISAARDLAGRLTRSGRAVDILLPNETGKDFSDIYKNRTL